MGQPQEPLLKQPEPADQQAKSLQDEADARNVQGAVNAITGTETTGVGQPKAQAVQQGNSLGQSAVPVTPSFDELQQVKQQNTDK